MCAGSRKWFPSVRSLNRFGCKTLSQFVQRFLLRVTAAIHDPPVHYGNRVSMLFQSSARIVRVEPVLTHRKWVIRQSPVPLHERQRPLPRSMNVVLQRGNEIRTHVENLGFTNGLVKGGGSVNYCDINSSSDARLSRILSVFLRVFHRARQRSRCTRRD